MAHGAERAEATRLGHIPRKPCTRFASRSSSPRLRKHVCRRIRTIIVDCSASGLAGTSGEGRPTSPLGSQQAAQHPRTCERELQVQLVEPPHQRKVCIRYWRRFVVDAASADAEERCLLGQCKPVVTVDHRFALGHPALPSARSKKSFSSTSTRMISARYALHGCCRSKPH
jgi:hypothetical protein